MLGLGLLLARSSSALPGLFLRLGMAPGTETGLARRGLGAIVVVAVLSDVDTSARGAARNLFVEGNAPDGLVMGLDTSLADGSAEVLACKESEPASGTLELILGVAVVEPVAGSVGKAFAFETGGRSCVESVAGVGVEAE
jgi:hypothetical protein